MRVLFRVALALLIGIPICLALMVFFILDARGSVAAALAKKDPVATPRARLGPHRAAT